MRRYYNTHEISELSGVRRIGRLACAICFVLLIFVARAHAMYSLNAGSIDFAQHTLVEAPRNETVQAEPAETATVAKTAAAGADELKPAVKEKMEYVAIKNNLLYDAAATPNLQLEIRLAPHWSLELGGGFNPFPLDDTQFPKWRHFSVSVAPRYWICNVFHRDFVSVNMAYAHYNVAGDAYPIAWMYKEVKENRYQGDALLVGASYGWHFAISPHFSIELEGGIEAGYSWFDQFECEHCGDKTASGGRWVVLPKAGVNLVVPLGGDEASMARRCDCEKLATITDIEEAREEYPEMAALETPGFDKPEKIIPVVPPIVVPENGMQRLRSKLLRDEEEYEPYNRQMALSADPRNVFIFFDVDVTKMDRSFLSNDLLMDSIMHVVGGVLHDSLLHITRIQIVGFASFDAKQAYNERLAEGRANTIKQYIQTTYSLPDSLFTVCNGGESWAELYYGLKQVEFEGRDEVLSIIDTEDDPDKREVLIKKLHGGRTYRYMRDELKYILRNLGCITVYVERK